MGTNKKVTAKLLFVQSERSEEALISKSLLLPLLDRKIALSVIMYDTKIQNEPNAKKILRDLTVPFTILADYGTKNVKDILLHEKPDIVAMIVDFGPIPRAFVVACRNLEIPFVVTAIDVQSNISSVEQNVAKLLKLISSRMSRLPNMAKMYLYYFRTKLALNPSSIINIPSMSIEFIQDVTDPIAGQSSDYVLTATQSDATFLRRNCPQAQLVLAVGNPLFDSSVTNGFKSSKAIEEKMEVQKLFRIPDGKKIVLVLSGAQTEHGLWTEDQKLSFYRQMFDSFEKFEGRASFIVKLHPAEINIFPKIWQSKYDKFIEITSFNLSKLIIGSDVVISWFSRAMIDVVIARKPLIVVDFFDDRERFNLLNETANIIDQNIALVVSQVDELTSALANIIENVSFRRQLVRLEEDFYSKNFSLMDGKSAVRIAETIEKIIISKPIARKLKEKTISNRN